MVIIRQDGQLFPLSSINHVSDDVFLLMSVFCMILPRPVMWLLRICMEIILSGLLRLWKRWIVL